ncbi:MAG TPA: DUF2784 family protein [Candidatus Paceibacterota bacterium]|nr:DUF2784 family protein [Candidatus Paceibacterota bacterium]
MRNTGTTIFFLVVTTLHMLIVIGGTLSLPLVLIYPGTRPFVLIGIIVLLSSWALFTDCPLTTLERRVRDRLRWPQLKGDFFSFYFSKITGLHFPQVVHRYAERVYLMLVIAIIIIR